MDIKWIFVSNLVFDLFPSGCVVLAILLAYKEVKVVKHIPIPAEEILDIVFAVTSLLASLLHEITV